jgi:hypothetical protein
MRQVSGMTETTIASILADRAGYLVATAARAPSVHNTQPWRFRVSESAVELYCDPRRKLQIDPVGREMLISCGAALFGLRLAVRSLGYEPVVELLPDPGRLRLLARVRLGGAKPMTGTEREMLKALAHRHTHRGRFAAGPLPAGLLAGLQHDALAERATLVLVEPGLAYERLACIARAVHRRLTLEPLAEADTRRWSRDPASGARDGVPAYAFPATPLPAATVPGSAGPGSAVPGSAVPGSAVPGSVVPAAGPGSAVPGSAVPGSAGPGSAVPAAGPGSAVPGSVVPAAGRRRSGRLPQRDFDLGRGFGLEETGGPEPAATAVLVTSGDTRVDWLRAGQALHRLLAHAASMWVFASLDTQLLEITLIRALIRERLALPGAPQMLLQFGVTDTTHPTGRRPPEALIDP